MLTLKWSWFLTRVKIKITNEWFFLQLLSELFPCRKFFLAVACIVENRKIDLKMTSRGQVDPWVNYLLERKNFCFWNKKVSSYLKKLCWPWPNGDFDIDPRSMSKSPLGGPLWLLQLLYDFLFNALRLKYLFECLKWDTL